MQWRTRRGLVLGALALLILGIAGVWAYLRPSADPNPGILETSGRIEGDQAAVGAKVAGRIARLPIREGQALEAGQLIAQLSSDQATA
ncbi:MAG TPA: biotin/lipoyl-binding protein, partial [Candidatus Methylomirabilis sp.]|nr:biotin/lipoyl-binding protein [Candidatus Methylomirabilis sp.]